MPIGAIHAISLPTRNNQYSPVIAWPRPNFREFKPEVENFCIEENASWMDAKVLVSASLATTQGLYGGLAMDLLVLRDELFTNWCKYPFSLALWQGHSRGDKKLVSNFSESTAKNPQTYRINRKKSTNTRFWYYRLIGVTPGPTGSGRFTFTRPGGANLGVWIATQPYSMRCTTRFFPKQCSHTEGVHTVRVKRGPCRSRWGRVRAEFFK